MNEKYRRQKSTKKKENDKEKMGGAEDQSILPSEIKLRRVKEILSTFLFHLSYLLLSPSFSLSLH